jgi:hypothetical protein
LSTSTLSRGNTPIKTAQIKLNTPIIKAKNLPKKPGLISAKNNFDCPITEIVRKTIPDIKNKVVKGGLVILLSSSIIFIIAITSQETHVKKKREKGFLRGGKVEK